LPSLFCLIVVAQFDITRKVDKLSTTCFISIDSEPSICSNSSYDSVQITSLSSTGALPDVQFQTFTV
ncbi:MAG: hypothetical protein ACI845_004050, partial [Gammaproteobacteria bacterium]